LIASSTEEGPAFPYRDLNQKCDVCEVTRLSRKTSLKRLGQQKRSHKNRDTRQLEHLLDECKTYSRDDETKLMFEAADSGVKDINFDLCRW
jgi:hypothetical protein